jgi:hypothetical protein
MILPFLSVLTGYIDRSSMKMSVLVISNNWICRFQRYPLKCLKRLEFHSNNLIKSKLFWKLIPSSSHQNPIDMSPTMSLKTYSMTSLISQNYPRTFQRMRKRYYTDRTKWRSLHQHIVTLAYKWSPTRLGKWNANNNSKNMSAQNLTIKDDSLLKNKTSLIW